MSSLRPSSHMATKTPEGDGFLAAVKRLGDDMAQRRRRLELRYEGWVLTPHGLRLALPAAGGGWAEGMR